MSQISVIIPLYNKASTIGRTIQYVLKQTSQPCEIIVVDDGSTDLSADIVAGFDSPLLKLVRQPNRGVSAARNRGIEMASGEWIAFLDGDDYWIGEHLKAAEQMISKYPEVGVFGFGFAVDDGHSISAGDFPHCEGVVNFFEESMSHYVLIPSATVVRRDLLLAQGGFPEGMRMGEDQYLWTKLARVSGVAFSEEITTIYSRAAENRSAEIYTPEQTDHSLEELYDPEQSEISNEYVARVALGKALVQSARGGTAAAQRALEFFSYNKMSHRLVRKVRLLNSLPRFIRPLVYRTYNWLAWHIAGKGL